ncbi:MAG: 4Fe-4S binding protein [Deltaproteobacteria bacterium]|nr:4Fe-4S binding protein [Deltaproteobacteria bacterium]
MELKAIHENCSGCGVCRLVCSLENYREVNPAMAALKIEGRFPAPGDYLIHLCNQCGQCAEACPVDAIPLKNGVYLIDAIECTGCMICVQACPSGVFFEHVEACPSEALQLVNSE